MSDLSPRDQAFAKVDLMTAELEMAASIYDGFSTAIVVKGQPRTVGLFREFDDAVQMMALIDQSKAAPVVAPADKTTLQRALWRLAFDQQPAFDNPGDCKWRLSASGVRVIVDAILALTHPAPVCPECKGNGVVEYEGGDGEGYPSRTDTEDCPRCIRPAPDDKLQIAVLKLESIRMMRSDRAGGPYPKSYKGGFDAAADLMSGWAEEALAALKAEAADHG